MFRVKIVLILKYLPITHEQFLYPILKPVSTESETNNFANSIPANILQQS